MAALASSPYRGRPYRVAALTAAPSLRRLRLSVCVRCRLSMVTKAGERPANAREYLRPLSRAEGGVVEEEEVGAAAMRAPPLLLPHPPATRLAGGLRAVLAPGMLARCSRHGPEPAAGGLLPWVVLGQGETLLATSSPGAAATRTKAGGELRTAPVMVMPVPRNRHIRSAAAAGGGPRRVVLSLCTALASSTHLMGSNSAQSQCVLVAAAAFKTYSEQPAVRRAALPPTHVAARYCQLPPTATRLCATSARTSTVAEVLSPL